MRTTKWAPVVIAAAIAATTRAGQSPRVPSAVVDLRSSGGAGMVTAKWMYADADIIGVGNRWPGPDNKASGAENTTHTLSLTARDFRAVRAASVPISAASLEQRRSPGKVAFGWYTLEFIVPQRIGDVDTAGATLVLEIVVDDYAEVWADGRANAVLGGSRGPLVSGWNSPSRVLLTRDAVPGTTHTVSILAANGPFSDPPSNFVWVRSATLDVYTGERELTGEPVETTIARSDPSLDDIIAPGTKIERVASGFVFGEGPVWVPAQHDPVHYGGGGAGGYLLFSDPNQNVIHRYDPDGDVDGSVTTYRTKSGYTGADIGRYFQPGSNGLALDGQGRLTICEHGNRRVTRLEKNGALTVIADAYEGKRLNSPNDLVYRSDGTLYFTDPPFGLPRAFDDTAKELPWSGVFRVSPDGQVRLAANDLAAPNGLAFSPDEKFLYVDNWETNRRVILRYEVGRDGSLSNPTTFFDMTGTAGEICLDGLKVDTQGNIFVSGPGGVWIINRSGKHLGTLSGPELPANFAWGDDDKRTLYLTARTGLYRIRCLAQGR